ncbi:protein FAM98B [Sardina pilchardus]|uniref:protein FAM98B n=1 Tax=Sardina pilchardus TaxID=27697 RepID=UPI002E14F0B8
MDRTSWTVCAIHALGYHGRACMTKCTCEELPCPLITWLISELKSSCLAPDAKGKNATGTVLAGDLRAYLKEMSCPYTTLISETLTPASLNQITEFLVSELQAAYMIKYKENHPEDRELCCESVKDRREEMQDEGEILGKIEEFVKQDDKVASEAEESKMELSLLLEALSMDASSKFIDLENQVKSSLAKLPEGDIPKPLLNIELNSDQWRQIEKLNEALATDYKCRRQMMMKRFEVTLQSFTWGERGKERAKAAASLPPLLPSSESQVSLSRLLAAREDQSRILPVRAGPSTAVHKVLMGSVPDRGGRPGEIEPPMPDWKRERAHGDNSQRKYRPRKKSRK